MCKDECLCARLNYGLFSGIVFRSLGEDGGTFVGVTLSLMSFLGVRGVLAKFAQQLSEGLREASHCLTLKANTVGSQVFCWRLSSAKLLLSRGADRCQTDAHHLGDVRMEICLCEGSGGERIYIYIYI